MVCKGARVDVQCPGLSGPEFRVSQGYSTWIIRIKFPGEISDYPGDADN